MGLLVSADFGEELEPRPEKMKQRIEEFSQQILPFVTLFEFIIDHPKEFAEGVAIFNLVKDEYADSVEDRKLIAGAISGMVNHLDPHSRYFDSKEFQESIQDINGSASSRWTGVGVKIADIERGWLKIGTIVENSPAHRAGLQLDDLITHVNGISIRWQTQGNVLRQVRGAPQTKVNLTIFRKKEHRVFTIAIHRENITPPPTVQAKWVESGFAWVSISSFNRNMMKEFTQRINALYQENPRFQGLVLDLRDNPGGLISSAVELSSAFLPANKVVATFKGRSKENFEILKTSHQKKLPTILQTVPMVILVNEGSASASEMVSGALQDYRRATIIGRLTFGKGIAQTMLRLGHDTGWQITTKRSYLPSGRSIQAKGVVPDIRIHDKVDGSPYADLGAREVDLHNHLPNDQDNKSPNPIEQEAQRKIRQQMRQEALSRWEDEQRKPLIQRKPLHPPLGSPHDFQLLQALNHLKGLPVQQAETPHP